MIGTWLLILLPILRNQKRELGCGDVDLLGALFCDPSFDHHGDKPRWTTLSDAGAIRWKFYQPAFLTPNLALICFAVVGNVLGCGFLIAALKQTLNYSQ